MTQPFLNGLSRTAFPPLAFIDLDGVVFKEGTNDWLTPDTLDTLKDYIRAGWHLVFWSSGLTPVRVNLLSDALGDDAGKHASFSQKPLASAYCYIDDRLTTDLCSTRLLPPVTPTDNPAWSAAHK